MGKEDLINRLYKRLPHPNGIVLKDIYRSEDSIYFSWDGKEYKVSTDLFVEQTDGTGLFTSDTSVLIEALLKL